MKKFFVICPLGFEMRLAEEIRHSWPHLIGKDGRPHEEKLPVLQMKKGGIEFECEEVFAYQLNFFLKTASRILLRLAEFKARDFPKLHEKIKVLPWGEYFSAPPAEYVVAASQSRLGHEGRIEETFQKTLKSILKTPAPGAISTGKVYVRIDNDLCTVSLDTSGEHLHKRGWATLKGEAPVRETIAAFILQEMIGTLPAEELAKVTLLDPMMGSGTFLLEARSLHFPHWRRPFAFQAFKSCPKIFVSPSFIFNYRLPVSRGFKAYKGFDQQEKMLPVAEANWQSLEEEIARSEKKNFVPANVEWAERDVFEEVPEIRPEPLWIVSNPPYGERLHDSSAGDVSRYFEALAPWGADKIALLHPEKSKLLAKDCPEGYRIKAEISIMNGGLRARLTVLAKKM